MVLDYSKWDALELSDDSDIEVHPNVDKRSFIRAKQNQIHQQRMQRRHEIETLKYERIINDGLLERIDKLLGALRQHEDSSRNPEELVFQSLIESAGDPAKDQPPAPPAGIYTHEKEQPKYSQMMSSLVDQVKKEITESKSENGFKAYITGVQGHKDKVLALQQELLQKLTELEKEEASKITSDSIRTGFDSSFVAKSDPKPKGKTTETKVELLNSPSVATNQGAVAPSSGAEADVEDDDDEEVDIKVSDLAKKLAKIPMTDYKALFQFISANPDVVAEKETDGLLVEAFNSQMDGKAEYARQCVHHGLLLQYCRSLGRDGISLFFKRITTKDHQAATLFRNDVNETYNKIKIRAAELAKNRSPGNDPAGVEQIQLHAVDPNTQINISIPPADSTNPEEIEARKIFDSFPPGLQRALQSASLDEEAEEIVEKLGEGGMLSVEEGIVDATTEEGRKKLEEIEAEGKREREIEEIGEPAEDQLD
uniref:Hsp90 chaperone protein kinase-targeting subunit n=1 Tax=Talaromyces marneffei PM1 TaxID=1077442 RepID=A0A093XPA3_TALMA